jgi:SH3 domain protein
MKIKKDAIFIFSIFILFLQLLPGRSMGDTRYISDVLFVNLRADIESQEKITALRTDTAVEVLEENGNFFKVRTQDQKEGWVPKRYVTSQKPKVQVIEELNDTIRRLNEKLDHYKKDKEPLREELEAPKRDYPPKLNELEGDQQSHARELITVQENFEKKCQEAAFHAQELNSTTNEDKALLEQSSEAVKLMGEHENFQVANAMAQAKLEALQQENFDLRNSRHFHWFLIGGSVFFTGWVVGKCSRSRKYFI